MKPKKFEDPYKKIYDRAANRGSFKLSDDMVQAIQDCVSDPTGLKPFMREQLEQIEDLYKQLEDVNQKLQTQIDDARQTAISATRDAKIARIISISSLAIAAIALIAQLFSP